MASWAWKLRACVLVAAGAIAVHELRYLLAPLEAAERHAYLSWATPAVLALAGLIAAELAVRLGRLVRRARGTRPTAPVPPSPLELWTWLTLLLVAVYSAQEAIELLAVHGHAQAHDVEAVLAGGGWLAFPTCLAVAGLLTLALRGAAAAVAWAIGRARRSPRRAPSSLSPRPRRVRRPGANVLARFLAGRAPPVANAPAAA